jgi:nucleoside-diphosphate-sugar epimerase
MMHAAAQGRPYACFVDADTRLPFMTMRAAVGAFLTLAGSEPDRLETRVYNVRSFSASAAEIREAVVEAYPSARITFEPASERQAIVDTWPTDVDPSAARRDWGFEPGGNLRAVLNQEFVPALQRRYAARVIP